MTITDGPLVRINCIQSYLGQEVVNVYHYKFEDPPAVPDLGQLASKFELDIINTTIPLQSTQLTYTKLALRQIHKGNLLLDKSLNVSGTNSGTQPLASFIAVSITLDRVDADTRNGRKSFAGLDENNVSDNNLESGTVTGWQVVADALTQPIVTDAGEWKPVILGKQLTDGSGFWYINKFQTASVNPTVRSQVSRRSG